MQSVATTVDEYMQLLPAERKDSMAKLRNAIRKNIPKGYKEQMAYGMPGYVIPHSLYPPGYHCDPKLPLMMLSFASQKNFIAVYHMGLYMDKDLMDWFTAEYVKQVKGKLDMGKSCIRFKKPDEIPFQLIGALAAKLTPGAYIECYEKVLNRPRK